MLCVFAQQRRHDPRAMVTKNNANTKSVHHEQKLLVTRALIAEWTRRWPNEWYDQFQELKGIKIPTIDEHKQDSNKAKLKANMNVGSYHWKLNMEYIKNLPFKKNIWTVVKKLVFAATTYFLWQERNMRLFHKVKRTEDELWKVIEETIKMKLSGLRVKESSNVKEAKESIISMANENDQPTGEDDLTTKIQTEMRLHTSKNISPASSIAMAFKLKNKSSTQKFEESFKGEGSRQLKKDFKKMGATESPNANEYHKRNVASGRNWTPSATDLVRFLLGVRNFFLVPYVQSKTRVSLVPGLTARPSSGVRMSEGHWFSFENKSGGHAKKCFKEITLSLKGDANHIAGHVILIRKPLQPLLYLCGLTTDYRHLELSHVIKDPEGKVITMEDFLNLHDWNRTFVSKGDPIPDNECPLVRTTAPLPVGSGLCISSYGAWKEMISHLATPLENEVLRSLTNYEVVRRTYQSFGRSILSQAELLRRFEQLNRDHLDLYNRSEVHTNELNRLRSDFQMERWSNDGSSKKLVLLESTHAQSSDKERELSDRQKDMEMESDELRKLLLTRMRVLEEGKARLVGQLAQSERARQGVIHDFISTVVGRLLTSVEYRKSLAIPIGLSFIAGWLGGLSLGRKEDEIAKISDSHHLSLEDLIKVSLGTPPTTTYDQAGSSVKNGVSGLAKLDSPNAHPAKTLIEPPLKTTA
nr:transposase (putative), gypsy type [Tanacetum cinerariifolium]